MDEIIIPGDLITRKIGTLISKASMIVVDLSGNNENVMWELGNAMSKNKELLFRAKDYRRVRNNISFILISI